MKTLIVFYSRTGTTKRAATALGGVINNCSIEEIISPQMKLGFMGYLKAGQHTFKKMKAEIEPVKYDPLEYDLVVIGTPVWIGTMASPVRSYLMRYGGKFKKVAFFCTCGSEQDRTFEKMEGLSGASPVATLELVAKRMNSPESLEKMKNFVKTINSTQTKR